MMFAALKYGSKGAAEMHAKYRQILLDFAGHFEWRDLFRVGDAKHRQTVKFGSKHSRSNVSINMALVDTVVIKLWSRIHERLPVWI